MRSSTEADIWDRSEIGPEAEIHRPRLISGLGSRCSIRLSYGDVGRISDGLCGDIESGKVRVARELFAMELERRAGLA